MVRPEYNINDVSNQDLYNRSKRPRERSGQHAARRDLDDTVVALLEIDGSSRISAAHRTYLSDGFGNDQIFPPFDETERVGLLYRDLLGAGLAGMWSVDALIAEIAARRPHSIAMSRLLSDRNFRVDQLREWLAAAPLWQAHGRRHRNTFEQILRCRSSSCSKPCCSRRGRTSPRTARLDHGVGSDFWRTRRRSARVQRRCTDRSPAVAREHYPANVFTTIPDISSMAQLVEFTAEIAELKQAVPAFL